MTINKCILIFLFLYGAIVNAQYLPLYSDYLFNGALYNPAYTGTQGNFSATASVRKNWLNITSSPGMQIVSLEMPFREKKMGIGVSLSNENIGVSSNIGLTIPYAFQIYFDKTVLSLGVRPSFLYQKHLYTRLKNTDERDVSFMDDEQFLAFNVGSGIYLYSSAYYVGLSVPNILVNKQAYAVKNDPLPQTYFLSGGVNIKLGEKLDVKPGVLIHYIAGLPIDVNIHSNLLINNKFIIGGCYREFSTVEFIVAGAINSNIKIGYAYGYTKKLSNTALETSHELTVNYILEKKKAQVISPRYF